ncbi:MAG TPA: AAA family ATPase [Candidatus Syntrophoarchaeum butanivorans]|uniref:Proteasome-activating nucleotidase n=1 Tax=Candidatus Syntropharchaeum butanivorans TaxID=1839936 RepID=A0A1F2P4R5_9EURY|nr:MAG: peptidase [Candidatus Syntrophoarchaeum butanivorans]RJS73387.1 MAG: AAA family ATPase [Candidatus Syntrophoarchaeum sp. WYZ-LMO15]HDM36405.1 AAA family ATPase [Candidatus Syntrophoarchaeum butanivorans]HEC56563.1 AAA family ATPase [Candidatus Syntrophoarchaeum butanivorans]
MGTSGAFSKSDRGDTNEIDLKKKDKECDEFSKYLLDRMRQLEEYNTRLKEETRKIESEKKFAESQKVKYEREVRRLRSEIERMKAPPLLVGTVIETLEGDKVLIKSSAGPHFVVNVSTFIKKGEIYPGAQVALNQQSLAVVNVLPSPKDPLVHGMEIIETPTVGYEDIGGLETQIEELRETVELPLVAPERFERIGIEPPKGVLLIGPPGCGKTLLAKAVARETNATFIRIVGSELVQKYIGEGARLVREIFLLAKEKAPSIIFIDEIDAIGAKRIDTGTSGDREVQRTLMQLLAEMDGFDPRGDVKLLAATNRHDILDPALLRPGRFDRIITVPVPTFDARVDILRIHTRKMQIAEDVSLERLAALTPDATGADLKAIVMEAGMFAVKYGRDKVEWRDFERAIDKVMNASSRPSLQPKDSSVMFA